MSLKPFFVYLLRCADGSYYAGHTDDLERRVAEHCAGEIAGYTHDRRPVTLVWSQEAATRDEALAAELQIKGWGRAKKEALIAGDWERVGRLARSATEKRLRQAQPERVAPVGQPESGQSSRTPGQSSRTPVRPEPVEGAAEVQARLRQAQPERVTPVGQPESGQSSRTPGQSTSTPDHFTSTAVRPEPVEGAAEMQARLRQAQPERVATAVASEPANHVLDAAWLAAVTRGERRALAKAITLLESTRPDHRIRADSLLNALLPLTGRGMRLGISGVPGVGKSTFIESLGLALIDKGHRVAVLAIDPSSSLSGGSILGDKTRMERLSVNDAAYIRPSPASGTLGGVAEKTREAMLVCEAAGYDVVIVETVGVGQSETTVASMTDMFVLLQLPNAGDDLQAIKKGVMELADLVVINKADLDPNAATRAEAQISSSLRLFGAHAAPDQWITRVIQISALKGSGIDAFWSCVEQFHRQRRASGEFDSRRRQQVLAWMWDIVQARLQADFRNHPAVRNALPATLRDVTEARVAPSAAARALLNLFENN
jgi:LAO/AO transport system kinase